MPTINRIRAKWDAQAAPQLRAEIERLTAALEAAEARAAEAELRAEYWREAADQWQEEWIDEMRDEADRTGCHIGISMDGHIGLV